MEDVEVKLPEVLKMAVRFIAVVVVCAMTVCGFVVSVEVQLHNLQETAKEHGEQLAKLVAENKEMAAQLQRIEFHLRMPQDDPPGSFYVTPPQGQPGAKNDKKSFADPYNMGVGSVQQPQDAGATGYIPQ
jgi:hypothetical protein